MPTSLKKLNYHGYSRRREVEHVATPAGAPDFATPHRLWKTHATSSGLSSRPTSDPKEHPSSVVAGYTGPSKVHYRERHRGHYREDYGGPSAVRADLVSVCSTDSQHNVNRIPDGLPDGHVVVSENWNAKPTTQHPRQQEKIITKYVVLPYGGRNFLSSSDSSSGDDSSTTSDSEEELSSSRRDSERKRQMRLQSLKREMRAHLKRKKRQYKRKKQREQLLYHQHSVRGDRRSTSGGGISNFRGDVDSRGHKHFVRKSYIDRKGGPPKTGPRYPDTEQVYRSHKEWVSPFKTTIDRKALDKRDRDLLHKSKPYPSAGRDHKKDKNAPRAGGHGNAYVPAYPAKESMYNLDDPNYVDPYTGISYALISEQLPPPNSSTGLHAPSWTRRGANPNLRRLNGNVGKEFRAKPKSEPSAEHFAPTDPKGGRITAEESKRHAQYGRKRDEEAMRNTFRFNLDGIAPERENIGGEVPFNRRGLNPDKRYTVKLPETQEISYGAGIHQALSNIPTTRIIRAKTEGNDRLPRVGTLTRNTLDRARKEVSAETKIGKIGDRPDRREVNYKLTNYKINPQPFEQARSLNRAFAAGEKRSTMSTMDPLRIAKSCKSLADITADDFNVVLRGKKNQKGKLNHGESDISKSQDRNAVILDSSKLYQSTKSLRKQYDLTHKDQLHSNWDLVDREINKYKDTDTVKHDGGGRSMKRDANQKTVHFADGVTKNDTAILDPKRNEHRDEVHTLRSALTDQLKMTTAHENHRAKRDDLIVKSSKASATKNTGNIMLPVNATKQLLDMPITHEALSSSSIDPSKLDNRVPTRGVGGGKRSIPLCSDGKTYNLSKLLARSNPKTIMSSKFENRLDLSERLTDIGKLD